MKLIPNHPIFKVPMPIIYLLMVVTVFALLPPAIIAKIRSTPSDKRRIHLIQNMDNQPRYEAQQTSAFFKDNRSMRPLIPGVVERKSVIEDDHFVLGYKGGVWSKGLPVSLNVDQDFLRRGQARFNIYCSVCHGYSGYGDGVVHQRAQKLLESGVDGTMWVAPSNLHEEQIREQPLGKIYNTITNGIRNMAGYKSQIPTKDRWAIAAYVRALQLSQNFDPKSIHDSDAPFGPLGKGEEKE